MSEIVERVAKAIYAADGGVDWDQQTADVHEYYSKRARAAIEAMREPTISSQRGLTCGSS